MNSWRKINNIKNSLKIRNSLMIHQINSKLNKMRNTFKKIIMPKILNSQMKKQIIMKNMIIKLIILKMTIIYLKLR